MEGVYWGSLLAATDRTNGESDADKPTEHMQLENKRRSMTTTDKHS